MLHKKRNIWRLKKYLKIKTCSKYNSKNKNKIVDAISLRKQRKKTKILKIGELKKIKDIEFNTGLKNVRRKEKQGMGEIIKDNWKNWRQHAD